LNFHFILFSPLIPTVYDGMDSDGNLDGFIVDNLNY